MTANKSIQINFTTEEKEIIGNAMDLLRKVEAKTQGFGIDRSIKETQDLLGRLIRGESFV